MTRIEWAKKEIELYKSIQNECGKECADIALKAFILLAENNRNEFCAELTKKILNKFIDSLSLTPIGDNDFEGGNQLMLSQKEAETIGSITQCIRKDSLFRIKYLNGETKYDDSNRIVCYNCGETTEYYCNKANDLINELFPIKMPYRPKKQRYVIIFDTTGNDIINIITPRGEELNRKSLSGISPETLYKAIKNGIYIDKYKKRVSLKDFEINLKYNAFIGKETILKFEDYKITWRY